MQTTPMTGTAPADARYAELALRYEEVAARMLEADRESGELVKLYVALRRLYEAPDREGVLAAVAEIVVSVLGSESFAVFEASPDGARLTLAESMGVEPADWRELSVASHPIARLAAAGELHVARSEADALFASQESPLAAVVPLPFGDALAGALVIFRLLPHRAGLDAADLDLLQLLSQHAAPAIRLAALRAGASRPTTTA